MRSPRTILDLPTTIPLFPLSGAMLLPHTHRPLNIFEPRFVRMVDHALAGDRLIGMIQPLQSSDTEAPKGQFALQKIGCLGRIVQFEEQEEERYFIVLEGVCRFELIDEIAADTPFRQGKISAERYASDFTPGFGAQAVDREKLIALLREYSEFAQFEIDWEEIERTGTEDLVNLCCMLSPYGPREKQALLEAETLSTRAETLIALAEIEMARARAGTVLQ
jgi:uncharacterized protein